MVPEKPERSRLLTNLSSKCTELVIKFVAMCEKKITWLKSTKKRQIRKKKLVIRDRSNVIGSNIYNLLEKMGIKDDKDWLGDGRKVGKKKVYKEKLKKDIWKWQRKTTTKLIDSKRDCKKRDDDGSELPVVRSLCGFQDYVIEHWKTYFRKKPIRWSNH